jgi:hypothetical protein
LNDLKDKRIFTVDCFALWLMKKKTNFMVLTILFY